MRSVPVARFIRTAGFTQVELVVVLVVLFILTGMAIPALHGLEGSRRDTATTRIRSVLIHAQMQALDIGSHTWVSFDPSIRRVEAFVEDRNNPGKANRLPLPDPLTRGGVQLQFSSGEAQFASIDIGGTTEVMFDPLGTPYDANGALLTQDGSVAITDGDTIVITMNTGLILIQ